MTDRIRTLTNKALSGAPHAFLSVDVGKGLFVGIVVLVGLSFALVGFVYAVRTKSINRGIAAILISLIVGLLTLHGAIERNTTQSSYCAHGTKDHEYSGKYEYCPDN